MRLSYRELEDFLSEIHMIAPSKRTALKGRLKHFQRAGWPAGTNKGKGARVEYGIGQTLLLAMGMELLQLGMTPERIVSHFAIGNYGLAQSFIEVVRNIQKNALPVVYVFCADALQPLQDLDDTFGKVRVIATVDELPMLLGKDGPFRLWRNFGVINLTTLMERYIEYFQGRKFQEVDEVITHLENWVKLEDNLNDKNLAKN